MPLKKNPKENKKTPPKLKGLQILQSRKKTNIDSNNSHKGNRTLARYIYRIVSIKSFKEEKKKKQTNSATYSHLYKTGKKLLLLQEESFMLFMSTQGMYKFVSFSFSRNKEINDFIFKKSSIIFLLELLHLLLLGNIQARTHRDQRIIKCDFFQRELWSLKNQSNSISFTKPVLQNH